MVSYMGATQSSRGKEIPYGEVRPQTVPIAMRSRTPKGDGKVKTGDTPLPSPRRITALGQASRESPTIRIALTENAPETNKEPDYYQKRQTENATRNTPGIVFPRPDSINPVEQREKELGHYSRRPVPNLAANKQEERLHKAKRIGYPDSNASSIVLDNSIQQSTDRTTPLQSPRFGKRYDGGRSTASSQFHRESPIIGDDPNSNMKSTPICGMFVGKDKSSLLGRLWVLPSSAERFVDEKGQTIIHELKRQKEAETEQVRQPSGLKRVTNDDGSHASYDGPQATAHVIQHHCDRLIAAAKIACAKRSIQPDNGGSVLLGTTDRDRERPQGKQCQATQGPPMFVPEPKKVAPYAKGVSRAGSCRRPDNNIFGTTEGSAATTSPARVARFEGGQLVERSGRGSGMYSPKKRTGEW